MDKSTEIRRQWEAAAPGWARWEETFSDWARPATQTMLDKAGVISGARVLDVACGAGSQSLEAARRVGAQGHVVASDIAEVMLRHVEQSARVAGLGNISTLAGAAEDLKLTAGSFDAAISRFGLMLFTNPGQALVAVRRALRPRGKMSVVVFTTPAANPFMARPMQILLRHAGKAPPAPGQPGIFSLGHPGAIERVFADSGYIGIDLQVHAIPLRMPSAAQALAMMQEAFGAYRAVINDSPEDVRTAAWAEVAETLLSFETAAGFSAPGEALVATGVNPG